MDFDVNNMVVTGSRENASKQNKFKNALRSTTSQIFGGRCTKSKGGRPLKSNCVVGGDTNELLMLQRQSGGTSRSVIMMMKSRSENEKAVRRVTEANVMKENVVKRKREEIARRRQRRVLENSSQEDIHVENITEDNEDDIFSENTLSRKLDVLDNYRRQIKSSDDLVDKFSFHRTDTGLRRRMKPRNAYENTPVPMYAWTPPARAVPNRTRKRPRTSGNGKSSISQYRKKKEAAVPGDRRVTSPYKFSASTTLCAFSTLRFGKEKETESCSKVPTIVSLDDDIEEVDGSPVSIIPDSSRRGRKRPKKRHSETYLVDAPEDYEPLSDDVRLQKLTRDELEKVKALTTKIGNKNVRAEIPSANIELRGEDLARLRGCRWLNDELINSYISLINKRNKDFFESQSPDSSRDTQARPRTYIFNTFFLPRLQQNKYDYNGVKRWTKRAGIEVAKLDRVLIPINLGDYHWLLAMIDLQKREFVYLDSMHGPDENDILGILRRWFVDEVTDKTGEDKVKELDVESWKNIVNPKYLPRQRDSGSCGVFTVYMADYLELNKTPNFTQLDIRVLRQRMALYFSEAAIPEQ